MVSSYFVKEPHFKPFGPGSALETLPKILASEFELVSVALVEAKRLEGPEEPKWQDIDLGIIYPSEVPSPRYRPLGLTTGDIILNHPAGVAKIVPYGPDVLEKVLRGINSNSRLLNGGVELLDGLYEQLDGERFTEEEIGQYARGPLSEKEALVNPVWLTLVPDKKRHEEYVHFVYDKNRQKNLYLAHKEKQLMGVYLNHWPDKAPTMRFFTIGDMGAGSDLFGDRPVVEKFSLIVGVSPAAASTVVSTHE